MGDFLVEAWPLARMWFFAQRAKVLPQDEDLAFCYGVLNKVSRRYDDMAEPPLDQLISLCMDLRS